ncbi:MAG: ATP-binding cassette domain-containing protein [Actinomycetota bacterium]
MSITMQCRFVRDTFSINVDVSVASGCVLGIAGENGSGKTTTLDMIAGLLPCTAGSIEVEVCTVVDPGEDLDGDQAGVAGDTVK